MTSINTERVSASSRRSENLWATNWASSEVKLRKAIGERFIQTVPKRGYRFIGDVKAPDETLIVHERVRSRIVVEHTDEKLDSEELIKPPETMYARSGDVNIAYQVIGDAPLDLVFVMGWVSHLEYFWREPSFARFLLRLASFSRLILFDKRGTGLSDRVPINQLPTLEQRMDDVRAVMNAVGSERAALCGVSEGGPMCSLFAATYPEKTLALVMIGTYAKRIRDAEYPWGPTAEQREEFFEVMREQWGGPVGIDERAPSVADDPKFRDWWATYLRMGASPGAAVALTKMNAEIDMVGDRPLAIFDGPARAVRCALAITEYASRLGVETRAGLHTGECEIVGDKVAGVAAEIGVCVANEARYGEVLVSSTVKDLVAGSGIKFEDRGIRVMSDCGEWRLFSVQRGAKGDA